MTQASKAPNTIIKSVVFALLSAVFLAGSLALAPASHAEDLPVENQLE
jgi:hypothetical protein